jgi:hypothetical protein
MFPVNRIVALLTPVFAAAAAVGSAWLTKHFPGLPTPSSGQILGVELAAATAAGGAALSWLKGHQQWEQRIDEAERDAIGFIGAVKDDSEKAAQPPVLNVAPEDPEVLGKAKAELARVEGLLLDARNALEGKPAVAAPPVAPAAPAPVAPAAPAAS